MYFFIDDNVYPFENKMKQTFSLDLSEEKLFLKFMYKEIKVEFFSLKLHMFVSKLCL